MPKISQRSIDEVLGKVALHEVIAQEAGVIFKPTNDGYKGLCPFHREKTPSFMVYNGPIPTYICFGAGCGEKGNVLTFLMKWKGFGFREAFDYAREWAKIPPEEHTSANYKPPPPAQESVCLIPWNLPPISSGIELPVVGKPVLVFNPGKGTTQINSPSHVHVYRSASGAPLLIVLRFQRKDGGKYFHQVTWKKGGIPTHPQLKGHWYQLAFEPNMRRPLYGLEDIPQWQQIKGQYILFVEGEKTRDAAARMLAIERLGILVLCNLGSTGAVNKIDWAELMESIRSCSSREKPLSVILWPDADVVLEKFDGTTINPQDKFVSKWQAEILKALDEYGLDKDAIVLRRVQPEKGRESGWDLADAFEEGWTKDDFISWYLTHSTLINDGVQSTEI